jgi:hypothetical protein
VDRQSLQNAQRAQVKQPRMSDCADVLSDETDSDVYDDVWPPRQSTSTRRYQSDVQTETGRKRADVQSLAQEDMYLTGPGRKSTVPPRRTATRAHVPVSRPEPRRIPDTEDVPYHQTSRLLPGRRIRVHWLVYIGGGMLVMLIGWLLVGRLLSWWQVTQDDWKYGRPRLSQVDAVVGHNDSAAEPSHFIALNLRKHIQIIELPGGDSTKMKVYVGPLLIGDGQELAPVTIAFKDVNGDGKPDMLVTVQDSHFVFVNENGAFRPLRPAENVQLPY